MKCTLEDLRRPSLTELTTTAATPEFLFPAPKPVKLIRLQDLVGGKCRRWSKPDQYGLRTCLDWGEDDGKEKGAA